MSSPSSTNTTSPPHRIGDISSSPISPSPSYISPQSPNQSPLTPLSSSSVRRAPLSVPEIDPNDPEQVRRKDEAQLQAPDSIMSVEIAQVMKEYITNGGSPPDVIRFLSESYRGYAQMCNLLCNWLSVSGVSRDQINASFKKHLKDIIIDKFDPKKADTIFLSSPPQWLDEMIADADWRSLIYHLSEVHKNCLMLNFAIQKISDAGYQNEIASLSTASTYFSVFNKVFLDSLTHLIQLDEIELQESIGEFKKSCCSSQHTYLYAQAFLQNLITKHPNALNLKRIVQDLEDEAYEKSKITRKISLMINNASQYPIIYETLTSILTANSTSTGDIIKLYNEYTKPTPPPVDFLRLPSLLELLVNDLFNPSKNIQNVHKSKWIYLISYAASLQQQQPPPPPPSQTNTTTISSTTDQIQMNETMRAIEKIQAICQANPIGTELQSVYPILKEGISYPIISMGLLQWIQFNLMNTNNLSANTLCAPIYLDFLREISIKHPLHRQIVLNTLVNYFELETDLDSLTALEMRKTIIDNLVFLFSLGHVIPVLNSIKNWVKLDQIDPSLVRYFINQALDIIEPPYSTTFIKAMKSLITLTPTTTTTVDHKDNIQIFLDQCK